MRVSVVRGGGIGGLVDTTTVDSESLAPADADALRTRLDESGAMAGPSPDAPATAPFPDEVSYRITVDDGGATTEANFRDGTMTKPVHDFLTWFATLAPAQRS